MTVVEQFIAQAQANAQQLAVKMAQLELNSWSEDTERQNRQYYGFTDKSLAKRKKELQKIAGQC